MPNRKKARSSRADAMKRPLPDDAVQRNARHEKTASNLAEPGDLPVEILAKEIPAEELHDM